MPIESGTTIAQLDESWPLGTDPTSSGDNHLRLIKAVLKAQFPGEAGDGFADIITATEAEMNYLVGVTSNIQEQIDDLQAGTNAMFPVGHHLFTTNTANPSTYGYPGTWILLDPDMSIQTSDTGTVGSILGENEVAVPLLEHSHNASFSGNNQVGMFEVSSEYRYQSVSGVFTSQSGGDRDRASASAGGNNNTVTNFSMTPSGSVSVDNAGEDDATIDVRGKRKNLLCWERTL